jgi:hypothetical protein
MSPAVFAFLASIATVLSCFVAAFALDRIAARSMAQAVALLLMVIALIAWMAS